MGIKYCVPQTVHMDTTPEKRMKFAEVIIRKCDEVSALTNDLFLHALSDMDKLEMNMHEVKLCAFMRKAVAELISDMDSVRLILPDSEWVISADEKRLMQLTENILNNAAKYGEMPARCWSPYTFHRPAHLKSMARWSMNPCTSSGG